MFLESFRSTPCILNGGNSKKDDLYRKKDSVAYKEQNFESHSSTFIA